MTVPSTDPSEAVVICTRNRPTDLNRALESIAVQDGSAERVILIIDGSDPAEARRTAQAVEAREETLPVQYHRYTGDPSGTRQRNAGIDRLPPSVQIVHFLDDDVTLEPSYFNAILDAFSQHASLLGVGGLITEPRESPSPPETSWLHRLFLLSSNTPSRVLPSGQTTPAWSISEHAVQPAEWLSTCASSYRRRVFDTHRFDPNVEGPSPRLEDLDFSYRVAQNGPLAVATKARCIHHVSASNRRNATETARERVARRYWFVEKNMNHLARRLAFWWSMIGKCFARIFSTHPDSASALRGLLQGIWVIWTRDHPLLRPDD